MSQGKPAFHTADLVHSQWTAVSEGRLVNDSGPLWLDVLFTSLLSRTGTFIPRFLYLRPWSELFFRHFCWDLHIRERRRKTRRHFTSLHSVPSTFLLLALCLTLPQTSGSINDQKVLLRALSHICANLPELQPVYHAGGWGRGMEQAGDLAFSPLYSLTDIITVTIKGITISFCAWCFNCLLWHLKVQLSLPPNSAELLTLKM